MRFSLIFALVLSAIGVVRADESKPIQLFNGKDLSGWTAYFKDPNVKMEDVFTVKDGVIHCKGTPAGYIRTEKDYTSFVLKLQWRFIKEGNSGVLLRVQAPDEVWPKSVECQLLSKNAGDIWDIHDYPITRDPKRTDGAHTGKIHPTNEKPLGEWNDYEITADGTKLTLKVNGLIQNEATDFEVKPGKILLQSEGSEIEFRNIELTPIEDKDKKEKAKSDAAPTGQDAVLQNIIDGANAKPRGVTFTPTTLSLTPPPTSERPRPPETFYLTDRVTGTRLTIAAATTKPSSPMKGWHPIGAGYWKLEDGVIVGHKPKTDKGYGHLVSDDSYGDFTAKFKFKSIEGNSGFYYHSQVEGLEMHGIQCEIDPRHDIGGIYESYGRNWIVKPTAEEVAKFFKPDDWNEMTVEVKGAHIKVTVNGHTTVDMDDEKGKTEGHFALQMHSSNVDGLIMFKDIEINGDKK